MGNARKPLSAVNKFGRLDEFRPPGVSVRSAPPSKLVIIPDPRETAQSTVQQVTARADLTTAELARSEAPLLIDEPCGPDSNGSDAPMGKAERKA